MEEPVQGVASGCTLEGSAIEVRDLSISFGSGSTRVDALRGVSSSVETGEFVAVMGPSGSGKSTLLHVLGGLEAITDGHVEVAGQTLESMPDDALTTLRRHTVGFVFQRFNLVDMLTAEENVALPLLIAGCSERDAHARARKALEAMGLGERRDHTPTELSGGEVQRVAIARALVIEPKILLADEPTGNLDTAQGDQIVGILRRLADETDLTIVMVTHDSRVAAATDRILRLRDGLLVDDQQLPGTEQTSSHLLASEFGVVFDEATDEGPRAASDDGPSEGRPADGR